MKYLFVFFITFLTFGCDNKKRVREQQVLDSIAKIEKERLDSIEEKRADSLALFAWGDAKFGISMKQALKTNALKYCDVGDNELSFPKEKRRIADNKVEICQFSVFFEMDELTKILINSCPTNAYRIDDIESDVLKIAHEFEKKYGSPRAPFNKRLSITDFNEGEGFTYRGWVVGSKYITIFLGEESDGGKYFYSISISNYNFPTKKGKETYSEKDKQQLKEQKEREELEKYQF